MLYFVNILTYAIFQTKLLYIQRVDRSNSKSTVLIGLDMRSFKRSQIDRAKLVFHGRMARTPFLDHPAFGYSFETTGFQKYKFGAVAGPSIDIDNLYHEMSHAIDFVLCGDDIESRTMGGKYNFKVKMTEINGSLYEQVETDQCTMRECRVFAIQMRLRHMLGYKNSLDMMAAGYARLTVWLPDWFLIEGNSEAERINWCKNHIIKLYHQYQEQQLLDAFQVWLDTIHEIRQ